MARADNGSRRNARNAGTEAATRSGAGSSHLEQVCMHALAGLDARQLAGQNERREHHAAVQAREAVAAVHPLFDPDFVYDGSFPLTSQ